MAVAYIVRIFRKNTLIRNSQSLHGTFLKKGVPWVVRKLLPNLEKDDSKQGVRKKKKRKTRRHEVLTTIKAGLRL